MDKEKLKVTAFDILYRYAVDGESAENLKGEILGMGALIDEKGNENE